MPVVGIVEEVGGEFRVRGEFFSEGFSDLFLNIVTSGGDVCRGVAPGAFAVYNVAGVGLAVWVCAVCRASGPARREVGTSALRGF